MTFQRVTIVFFPGFDPGPPLDATAVVGACTVVVGSLLTSLGAPAAAPEAAPEAGLS